MQIWPDKFLLHCPFKKFTGFDCPLCGFQRSFLALLKGDFIASFHLYPATVPILFLSVFLLMKMKFPLDRKHKMSKALFFVAAATVAVSYVFKVKSYL